MGLENFIKTVWIANTMKKLSRIHVFADLANRNYQGQLNNLGDRVKIMTISDPTINSYTKNTDIDSPEDIEDAARELIVDQAKYFNFKMNDVDAVMEKTALRDEATGRGAYGFRNAVDTYFAGLYAQAGITKYTNATPADVTSLNVEDVILECLEELFVQDVPEENIFAVIPPWFHTKMVQAGLAGRTDNTQLYLNGKINTQFAVDFRRSNNVSKNSTDWDKSRIFFGVKGESFSFAEVMADVEAYRPEKRFEDAVKGLYVYGGKVMRPDKTLVLYADKTAEPS